MSEALTLFVREALAHGMSRPEIERRLEAAGWSADRTAKALDAWHDSDSPVHVVMSRPSARMPKAPSRPAFPTTHPIRTYMMTPRMVSSVGVNTPVNVPKRAVDGCVGGASASMREQPPRAPGGIIAPSRTMRCQRGRTDVRSHHLSRGPRARAARRRA